MLDEKVQEALDFMKDNHPDELIGHAEEYNITETAIETVDDAFIEEAITESETRKMDFLQLVASVKIKKPMSIRLTRRGEFWSVMRSDGLHYDDRENKWFLEPTPYPTIEAAEKIRSWLLRSGEYVIDE